MGRKLGQPTFPTLYFRDGILSVPGYTFESAHRWHDTGSLTLLAEGNSLKDGSDVLAKIAPLATNGSQCLEKEAHVLGRIAKSNVHATTLALLENLKIPREHGDCVVLILVHPGPNLLGRYLPPYKINDLLLAEPSRIRSSASMDGSIRTEDEMSMSEGTENAEEEETPIMDLASFLEFAIHATRCLGNLHRVGIIHREVRANAFHLNPHSGLVRLIHFGNRAISLENYGSPSSLVLRALEDDKLKVKEALCYLAPEQTGSIETMTQDHRTDLYSLGILFWTLLVGRGQMPFEGQPLELLYAIVQKRPMPVHEVRRDVPQVLAMIIEKLLAKSPDARYQSAHGLQKDLLECQRRLLLAISSTATDSGELITQFEIAKEDRFMEFTLPLAMFGREKELETIGNVIAKTSRSFSQYFSNYQGVGSSSAASNGIGSFSVDDHNDAFSTSSDSPHIAPGDVLMATPELTMSPSRMSVSPLSGSSTLRRLAFRSDTKTPRTQAILVVGPPGIGKSSLVLANQAKWRSHGLWGQAKFQAEDSAPFAALLSCLSSVLRQLMVFPTDLERFVTRLRTRIGPQLQSVPLLYQGAPELQDVFANFGIFLEVPTEHLNPSELRARFQSLVESVFSVIAETRLFALFLDDLHDADESSLDLVSTLMNSRSRMLILGTIRSGHQILTLERVRMMFANRSEPTWIFLEPLSYTAISSLVSHTLHRIPEDVAPLTQYVYKASSGNAFSARSVLTTLQRQHHILFDWGRNFWKYDMPAIEGDAYKQNTLDPTDPKYLTFRMRELSEEARKYLTWAVFFGETFKITEVALMMDWEDSSDDETDDIWNLHKAKNLLNISNSRASMRGLQLALQEGWLVQRAREMCTWTHDRYRQAAQAEADALPQMTISKMSLRIIRMMLLEKPIDVYRVAEHAKRCLPLLQDNPKREELLNILMEAGESAWERGAHELAIRSFLNARSLLRNDHWAYDSARTFALLSRLAELFTWKGDYTTSNSILDECKVHAQSPEDVANTIRLRSRNYLFCNNFAEALSQILLALKHLGVDLKPAPSEEEADAMFDLVKNEILAVGFDEIMKMPRATDKRTELAITLLNDAGLNSYWMPSSSIFTTIVGLTNIQLALRCGMAPGTALGFFWALGAVAEKRELYRFSVDLGKLALMIAETHGSGGEICRAQVLFCTMVSGYDSVHVRANIARLEKAIKYGNGAGDRIYTSLANVHAIVARLYVCQHLSELVEAAEECFSDANIWGEGGDPAILATGVLNCIRALGGYTIAQSADTLFDTESYNESRFLEQIGTTSGGSIMFFSWYNAFKVVSYFCTGYINEAAELGFSVFASRHGRPNHRHIRYSLFFHSLAMIACIRRGSLSEGDRQRYSSQITENQAYIRKWLSPSPVNTSTWVALVEAELASLKRSPDAFRLYDVAVRFAVENDWVMEEGWALYLQGSHFVRCSVEGLGSELQRRAIARHSQWGARGIVAHLNSSPNTRSQRSLRRPVLLTEVGIQTSIDLQTSIAPAQVNQVLKPDAKGHEDTLNADDLAAILRWSKDISSDINLSSALQRLTEIVTETSGSLNTCVVIAREVGDYTVATSMIPPGLCKVHEKPKPIRDIDDPLQKAIILHALNIKDAIHFDDASIDSRFSTEAGQTALRSVFCMPMFSNRGQTFAAVFISSNRPFSQNTLTKLTLLYQQASISISNALLFRSVQSGTKDNLKMIATQREALEAARKSREDALKATKTKSNFLASMSHELRTPFSSFYGLLDLLSGTELNPGQSEIVQTAKQSCELLLKIIDSILDYSKLEASAVKLEPSGFLVEDIIADCMELLLPMAAKKLDLSFNIEADVPPWVFADYAKIRQVLMNLIGNAVKFTAKGFVRVTCSVVEGHNKEEATLRFDIQDTGIGMSARDVDLLFVPFQQADNSSTRRFGGTGLGLSISRQLVRLMGGAIAVQSELNSGSTFWFTLPVKIYNTEETRKSSHEIEQIRLRLITPSPPKILVCSTSTATLTFLHTMLRDFHVECVSSAQEAKSKLGDYQNFSIILDFFIIDEQSEDRLTEILQYIHKMQTRAFQDTKIIHLYTPTTSDSGQLIFGTSSIPGVVKMTKPPRTARILHTLAEIKHVPNSLSLTTTVGSRAIEDLATTQRTLYGNVLIAEDNPIGQQLLIKQLERLNLCVTATGNGEEAIAAWEAHEPGYFSVALFDHHMPICDGVEATKRLRHLESMRKCEMCLPIVALSADCQESTKQLCLSAGMNAFFSKPLKKGDLTALLSMFGQSPCS
ncbi:Peroxide stress-activated histidine kinase mak2 [Termitomyces sp. T112]|nr:Peroxide stress-activated histidine kinase mak2 [Termitomyces sp. T112]